MPTSDDHDNPETLAAFLARTPEVIALLESVVEDRGLLAHLDAEVKQRLLMAAGRVARPDTVARRRLTRAYRKLNKKSVREADPSPGSTMAAYCGWAHKAPAPNPARPVTPAAVPGRP